MSHTSAIRTMASVSFLVGFICIGGCRSSDDPTRPSPEADQALAELVLAKRLRREFAKPDNSARQIPIDSWSDFTAGGISAKSQVTYTDALIEFASPTHDAIAVNSRDPQAISLYSSGRLKLADQRAEEALKDFETALALDPNSAELHRAVGDACGALGRRNDAVRSYERAASLGLTEAPVFRAIAIEQMRMKEWELAIRNLVSALNAPDFKQDSDLGVITRADLGVALTELGYYRAAETLLSDIATASFGTLATSRYRAELTEVFRRRSDIQVTCGDLALRRDEYETALEHYRSAATLPTADPLRIRLRIALAHLRAGRPAHAAQAVLNQLSDAKLRNDPRIVEALSSLATVASIREDLVRAIQVTALEGELSPSMRVRVLGSLLTGSRDDEERRDVLRMIVNLDPADGSGVLNLLATFRNDETSELASEIERVAERYPEHADVVATATIALGRGIADIMEELDGTEDAGPAIVLASLSSATGDPLRSLEAVRNIDGDSPIKASAIAQFSADAGDESAATGAIATLVGTDEETRRARLSCLMLQGDRRSAAECARELLASTNTPSETIQLCKVLIESGDAKSAESALQSMIRNDPNNEIPYELLVRLYAPGSQLADETKLGNLARQMRQHIENGRIMRTIQAQEALNRSLWNQAEIAFTDLLDPSFESPAVLESLVTLWERAAKAEPEITTRGEALLRRRIRDRSDSVLLHLALARVLVATDHAADAEALLGSKIESIPFPELRRQRERILREQLGKSDEADRLTTERLSSAPKSLNTALEWFDYHIDRGDVESAVTSFADSIPRSSKISAPAASRLISALSKVTPDRVIARGANAGGSLSALFDQLIESGASLPPGLHVIRLEILARTSPHETTRLIRATEDFQKTQPEMLGAAANQMFRWISDASNTSDGLRFLRVLISKQSSPDLIGFAIQQTCVSGSFEDAERLIRDLDRLGDLRKVLERVDPGLLKSESSDDQLRAELAYLIALEFSGRQSDDAARKLYRIALDFNSTHGWSANNLGFGLLESEGPTEEAARLIEIAARSLPKENSVIDSLAWLRFRQGRIGTDEHGEGALSLIQRAVGAEKDPSAEVLDHAGDIHWIAGQREKAIEFWSAAVARSEADIQILQQRGITGPRFDHFDMVGRRARTKADAARNGAEPLIER